MGDSHEVLVKEDSFSSNTTSASDSLYKFPKHLFILLILFLATSTINILIHTNMLFQCLAFFLFVCCAAVFSHLIVTALIFFIERYFFMTRKKALYFVFALKSTVKYFFCSSSILLYWLLVVKPDMTIFVIHFVTSTLATFVIATGMWMFKIVIFKVLECRLRDKNFFNNLQDLISHEYVLQTLLAPPRISNNSSQLKWIIGAVTNILLLVCTRLHTICDTLDKSNSQVEHQAENAISMVFKNLTNDELRDIQETDLLRVMKKEDITNVLQLFEGGAATKSISKAALRKWMVEVCNERKRVVHLLNTTSNVIQHLNKIVYVNLLFFLAIVWCLLMGFGTNKFMVYISSPILMLLYTSSNYYKMIWEGIMLAIVMHPFDIGDHCIIDNERLVVEEIGLIDTVFLNYNNEKVNYPNSILLTKSISNLNRSSELRDCLELHVSNTTPTQTIAALKLKISELLGNMPESWRAEHCFDLNRIDEATYIYNLQITHAANFQNYKEKKYQRSNLVLQLRMLLEELNINSFTIQ